MNDNEDLSWEEKASFKGATPTPFVKQEPIDLNNMYPNGKVPVGCKNRANATDEVLLWLHMEAAYSHVDKDRFIEVDLDGKQYDAERLHPEELLKALLKIEKLPLIFSNAFNSAEPWVKSEILGFNTEMPWFNTKDGQFNFCATLKYHILTKENQ